MILTVTLNPAIDKALEVPGFAVGAHARATVRSALPAGKGVNVARGVARMGGDVAAGGLIGAGEERLFARSLARDGVDALFCTVDGLTRTNTTVIDPDARTTTHLRETGFEVGPGDLAALERRLSGWVKSAGDGPVVVFAGSAPPGVGAAEFAALLTTCAEAGACVVVDANGPILEAAVASGAVHTLKPNLGELAQCLGHAVAPAEAPQAARALLECVDLVLLTLAEAGAWLVTEPALAGWACPLEPRERGNTVGCGDAFLAGWLRARQAGRPEREALRWAVAAGAASAASETTVGYTLADVERLLPRCQELAAP